MTPRRNPNGVRSLDHYPAAGLPTYRGIALADANARTAAEIGSHNLLRAIHRLLEKELAR